MSDDPELARLDAAIAAKQAELTALDEKGLRTEQELDRLKLQRHERAENLKATETE